MGKVCAGACARRVAAGGRGTWRSGRWSLRFWGERALGGWRRDEAGGRAARRRRRRRRSRRGAGSFAAGGRPRGREDAGCRYLASTNAAGGTKYGTRIALHRSARARLDLGWGWARGRRAGAAGTHRPRRGTWLRKQARNRALSFVSRRSKQLTAGQAPARACAFFSFIVRIVRQGNKASYKARRRVSRSVVQDCVYSKLSRCLPGSRK